MRIAHSLSLFTALLFAGCGEPQKPAQHAAGDGHGAEAGHEHAHGERIDLGVVEVGAHVIHVFQVAPVVAGKEGDFDLDFAATPLPGTVRGWIGAESGVGSMKVRFEKETDNRMHGHPEAPDPLPADSRLWIDIEGAGRASVAIRP